MEQKTRPTKRSGVKQRGEGEPRCYITRNTVNERIEEIMKMMENGNAVTVRKMPTRDIDEVLALARTLKGEDAVDWAIQTVDCPNATTAEEMLKAVTRFFSNVRFLCSQVERLLDGKGGAL